MRVCAYREAVDGVRNGGRKGRKGCDGGDGD